MSANPWDQQEGEPSLWFSRFEGFRKMGPRRTIIDCVRLDEAAKGSEKQSSKTPGAWSDAVEQWNWWDRAEAWDKTEAVKARAVEEVETLESRKAWIEMAREFRRAALDAVKGIKGEQTVRDAAALADAALRYEMHSRGLCGRLIEEGEDREAALAFYRKCVASEGLSPRDRLFAQSRIDKIQGFDSDKDASSDSQTDEVSIMEVVQPSDASDR